MKSLCVKGKFSLNRLSWDPGISFFSSFFNPHSKIYLLILERGEGKERNIDVREKQTGCLMYVPQPGNEPTILAQALTRN